MRVHGDRTPDQIANRKLSPEERARRNDHALNERERFRRELVTGRRERITGTLTANPDKVRSKSS